MGLYNRNPFLYKTCTCITLRSWCSISNIKFYVYCISNIWTSARCCSILIRISEKNRLKIPKGQSETINQRADNNTLVKRKQTKGQTIIYKTLHRKLQVEQHEHHTENQGELGCSGGISTSCSMCDTRTLKLYNISNVWINIREYQRWTIQRSWQHMVHKRKTNNPEKLATYGTQEEDKQNKNI